MYFFRNGSVPALSGLVAKEFKNAYHVKCLLENSLQQSPECQNFKVPLNTQCNESQLKRHSCQNAQPYGSPNTLQRSQPQQPESIRSKTLFEFLKMVHQKGKRKEQKKRKEGKKLCVKGDDNSEQIPSTTKTLHLNNLNENKDVLSKILVSRLLDATSVCHGAMENLTELDITFLLNLLTNDILQFPLDDKIYGAVNQIKNIRNEVFHSGSNFERTDMLQKLSMLYGATEVILSYLHKPSDEIERMKQECIEDSESISYRFLHEVLGK